MLGGGIANWPKWR